MTFTNYLINKKICTLTHIQINSKFLNLLKGSLTLTVREVYPELKGFREAEKLRVKREKLKFLED